MKKKIIISAMIAAAVLLGFVFYERRSSTAGLTKVEGYDESPCLAISAGCGECYGKVIDNECYVDKDKLTPEQLQIMGLE